MQEIKLQISISFTHRKIKRDTGGLFCVTAMTHRVPLMFVSPFLIPCGETYCYWKHQHLKVESSTRCNIIKKDNLINARQPLLLEQLNAVTLEFCKCLYAAFHPGKTILFNEEVYR